MKKRLAEAGWPSYARISPVSWLIASRKAMNTCMRLVAATAFRHGERWAWWALLAGNTMALVSAMRYDWVVNAIGPFELTEYLGLARGDVAC